MFGRYQVASEQEPRELRSTPSYIYYTDDKKGEGATGSVFGGREKKSGERVAVKVFSDVGHQRPGNVQEREFEVLPKLQHPNIVTLLGIEEDSYSHDRVIVMELCSGGSLFNVLDKPENSFGLAESEFLILLRDVSQGMKHLQDKGIVHRDLKPGNIMCCLSPDGSSVYKLADFGAARVLAEGEQFVSIYGTEEYLHPDVYERAVLRKPLVRPFTASVDLWSIGVTLFHAATGTLPFRPYGGRRNRATMHQMTTSKASGVISGVQKESENGRIEWSRELPKTTQMSQGLRYHVEDMLAGLLESDVSKMLSFPTFFDTAQSIVNKTALDVFCVMTSQLIKVYLDPTHSFAEFQEFVAMQTLVQSPQQMHVYEGAIFYPESTLQCRSFPETTPADPIFMFRQTFNGPNTSPVAPVAPNVPSVQTTYSLHTDAPATKRSIAALFALKRKQETLVSMPTLQERVVKAFTQVTKDEARFLSDHLSTLKVLNKTLPQSMANTLERVSTVLRIASSYRPLANGDGMDVGRLCDSLEILGEEVALKIEDVQQLSVRLAEVSGLMDCVNEALVHQDTLKMNWDKQSQCQAKDKCLERFDVKFCKILEIYSDFCRDANETTLLFNMEQIHKMGKIKVNQLLPELVSLVHKHCEANWLKKHSEMMDWCSLAYSLRRKIQQVDKGLTRLISDFSAEELAVSKLGERCRQKTDDNITDIISLLAASLGVDNHASSICSDNYLDQNVSRPPTDDANTVSLQTSFVDVHAYDKTEAMTQTDQWTIDVHGLSAEYGPSETGAAHNMSRALSDPLPRGFVPVPRDLKQGIQEWESERPKTWATIKKSQDLTEELQNMSLPGDLDKSLDMYSAW